MLNTLKTIKNLGVLLLTKADKQADSGNPYELTTCNIKLKKGSIAYQIDNFIDRGAVTMSDEIANALDAMQKAKVIHYSITKKSDILVCAYINLLREYVYSVNGDLINIFTATDQSKIQKSQSIPIDSFNYLFNCDPLSMDIYSDDLLQIAFSLIKLSELYNSVVFYNGKENLAVEIEGAVSYLLEDSATASLSPQTLDTDLKYMERHGLIDVEPSVIVLDTFRFYEWFSIMKNELGLKNTIRAYKEDDI